MGQRRLTFLVNNEFDPKNNGTYMFRARTPRLTGPVLFRGIWIGKVVVGGGEVKWLKFVFLKMFKKKTKKTETQIA